MENLGGWDQPEDHPDFDPNLLNVESWAVEHDDNNDHEDNNDHNKQVRSRNSGGCHTIKKRDGGWSDSHVDQWTGVEVTEFGEDDNTVDGISRRKSIKTTPEMEIKMHQGEFRSENSNNNNSSTFIQAPAAHSNNHHMTTIETETVEAAVEAAVTALSETSDSVASGDRSATGTSGSSENSCRKRSATHNTAGIGYGQRSLSYLHPLGIQSSASCPEPTANNGNKDHSLSMVGNNDTSVSPTAVMLASIPQQQNQHGLQGLCSVDLSQALERSVTAPLPANANGIATISQQISSLATNFALAQATGDSTITKNQENTMQEHSASATHQHLMIPSNSQSTNSNFMVHSHNTNKTGVVASSSNHKCEASQSTATLTTRIENKSNNTSSLPPFYLFGAPVELRANFVQNQRRLGLPIQHDPNSYHYGEIVNGFHPHQYQQLSVGITQPDAGGNHNGAVGVVGPRPPNRNPANPSPQLIDVRHGNSRTKSKGGQVKNEREQKRAQKITELIEQLRLQMEDGGWQVEARSKFHTLSNCAEYVKHMIKLTSDKEKENEKLKSDLNEKRRKIEREKEDKAAQADRSDPESVTSSLTSDTTLSSSRHKEESDEEKKRKMPDIREGSSACDSNSKKHRMVSSEATTEESSGEDRGGNSGTGSGPSGASGSGGPSAQVCSVSKTIYTISDITDSNRGSSSNNSGSGGGSSDEIRTEHDSGRTSSGNGKDEDQPSNSSISSDAAVASTKTSRDRQSGHKDVVFNNDKRMSRKRPPEEVTSLERSFELNYEEVFDKSNIPQLIASTSGKIVTWNECFIKVTGYRKSEIERMSIFSLVKPENLANFFDIVAAALRPEEGKNKEKHSSEKLNTEISMKSTEVMKNDISSLHDCYGSFTVEKSEEEIKCMDGEEKNVIKEKFEVDTKYTNPKSKKNQNSPKKLAKEAKVMSTKDKTIDKFRISKNRENLEKEEDHPSLQMSSSCNSNIKIEDDYSEGEEGTKNHIKAGGSTAKHLLDYAAMTLPCINFPAMKKRNQAAVDSDSICIPPLHVTVTLMADKDPRRRCFHCVFTNSKGTNGSLGIITPELLASLFAKPLRRRKKHHLSHGHQRKRFRARQSASSNETHHVQTISNEKSETAPSPLLMPPPGALVEEEATK